MSDELELLRRLGERLDAPGEVARSRARAALDDAIHNADTGRRRFRGRKRARLVRVGLVVAAAAAAVVVLDLPHTSSTPGPPVAAAAVLEQLAQVAEAQPSLVPAPGQYLYTAARSLTGSDTVLRGGTYCQVSYAQYRQNWIAADGSGLFREQNGPGHLVGGSATACDSLPEISRRGSTSSTWSAPGCLSISPIPLSKLPTNPAVLRARLLTGKVEGGPPGPGEAFTQVGDLLRETDASPALRAALYRAAAGLRGVRNLGRVTDPTGQSGAALAIEEAGVRHELIFSTSNGALIGEQGVLTAPAKGLSAKVGSIVYWSDYEPAKLVERLPEPSPLPLKPACVHSVSTSLSVPGHPDDEVLVGAAALRARSAPGS